VKRLDWDKGVSPFELAERADAAASALPEGTREARQEKASVRLLTVTIAAYAPGLRELAEALNEEER
jgi:hypothetical protein